MRACKDDHDDGQVDDMEEMMMDLRMDCVVGIIDHGWA